MEPRGTAWNFLGAGLRTTTFITKAKKKDDDDKNKDSYDATRGNIWHILVAHTTRFCNQ